MSKMKTKSGAKKRFRFTATGKIKIGQAGKRHRMRNRSQQTIRDSRGMTILRECDVPLVLAYMPYR